MNPIFCNFEAPTYLIFSGNVPHFIYYTHVTALVLSLIIGLFVLLKDHKSLINKILFWSLVPFLLWVFFNIIIWASNRSDLIMFLWSLQIMIEPLTYIGMLYLIYVFINKKDVSTRAKIIAGIIYLPLIIITPTSHSLSRFHLSLCIPDENYYSYYTYVLELLSVILIATYAYISNRRIADINLKKQIFYLSFGVILFLLTFASGNIFGSFTDNWVTSQFGLLGTPIFAAFIGYLIVRYKTFNIKILGAQALVVAIVILIGSQFLFIQNSTNKVLTAITLVLAVVFGWFLIKSVAREAKQKEQLTQYSRELANANLELQDAYTKLETLDKAKSEFVSIASHQLRTPLTAIKGYVSLMIEGDYGKLPKGALQSMKNVYLANERLVKLVNSLLDMSRLEAGKITLDFTPVKVDDIVADILRELRAEAENKNLKLRIDKDRTTLPKIEADGTKLRDALMNLVDNAIKYTNRGEVLVKIKYNSFEGNMEITVQDTGEGMAQEELDKLFQSFSRADSGKKNWAEGSGLGLYIAKKFIEMHHGNIRAESQGKGQGSRFVVELPISQPSLS